jgi:hypothetical protein
MPKPSAQPELPLFPATLDTPAFREAWAEWEGHRRDIRKRLTPRSARMLLKKLEPLGPDAAVAAIVHSIANGYTGIFPDPAFKPNAQTLKPSNAQTVTDERWLDALKVVLKDNPEYAEGGLTYERCRTLGYHALPFSLKSTLRQTARSEWGVKLP